MCVGSIKLELLLLGGNLVAHLVKRTPPCTKAQSLQQHPGFKSDLRPFATCHFSSFLSSAVLLNNGQKCPKNYL